VLDEFVLPGKTATIVLTGNHGDDLRHAAEVWQKLNPGMKIPADATFHHDLLNATEHIVKINGKQTKVLVGRMQLVPSAINAAVFHQGSASVARKYYQALGVDLAEVTKLAKKEVELVGSSRSIVKRALKKIKPGTIAKGLIPLVGRSFIRLIPIAGTGLALAEFASNAEAHGVDGAVARAIPVLGDLISAHDFGSDLATQIRNDADARASSHSRILNAPSRLAWDEANRQTIAAFNELAPQIKVTNTRMSDGGGELLDLPEIAGALQEYRHLMQNTIFKRNVGLKTIDFNQEAARHKQRLRDRLEHASQKNAPIPGGWLG
jgi:hypothetical protein